MTRTVISIEGLSKSYRLGEIGTGTFYGDLKQWWARQQGKPDPYLKIGQLDHGNRNGETIWALQDVNLKIQEGEATGIMGRNGAGKSTLLKILSQITAPTSGTVKVKGRIASLLEVGTGFHSELTGRENIYLNGAIMGMTRADITRKFDEIVDFSGVEQYIDTPVKRYSSGMYVRLAFAVAAHLEPEILVVDEVLAVGDVEFQKKCLGKMGDVAQDGRTVLFVSHNMVAIQQLCQRGIVIEAGSLNCDSNVETAITQYIRNTQTIITETELADRKDRKGSQWLKFSRIALYNNDGEETPHILSGQDINLRLFYTSTQEKNRGSVVIAFNLRNERGGLLTNLNSLDAGYENLEIFRKGYFECVWPKFNFRAGIYSCDLFCSVNGEIVDWLQNAFTINVEDGDFYHTGKMIDRQQGDVLVQHSWQSKST